MRFPLLLAAGWLANLGVALAAPPGYHPPRRYLNARNQPYMRPGMRLTVSGNLAYYNGDITNRLSDNTLRVGYGLGLSQVISPRVSVAAEASVLFLKAKDYYPSRGLSFDSNNGLLTATVRYNLLEDKSLYTSVNHKSTPGVVFVEAGLGAVLYNPTAYVADGLGHPVQLRPETNNRYPALAGVLPVGLGGTLRANSHLYLTLNALYYFTTTDLLDDISQRANPKQPDNFATLSLKAEFAFGKKKRRPLAHYD